MIAKNYLDEMELAALNNLVEQYRCPYRRHSNLSP